MFYCGFDWISSWHLGHLHIFFGNGPLQVLYLQILVILRIKSRASCILGRCSTTELYPISLPTFKLRQKSLDNSHSNPDIYQMVLPPPPSAQAE